MCLAIPGRILSIQGDGDLRIGEVDFGGVSRAANLAFVPEAVVGDYVLVHVGFAIACIDEAVAKETLEALTMFEALTDADAESRALEPERRVLEPERQVVEAERRILEAASRGGGR
jgi:hydrogenase expression/formation protein HypC